MTEIREVSPRIIENILREAGAIVGGHFVLKSGRHAGIYVNKAAAYTKPEGAEIIGTAMAYKALLAEIPFDIVVSAATGGIVLGHCTARSIGIVSDGQRRVPHVYADQKGSQFTLKRGFDKLVKGQNVLVVDDIMTTGFSTRGVCAAVRAAGGTVAGVLVMVDRCEPESDPLPQDRFIGGLLELKGLPTWERDECPLCKQDLPISTELGKGPHYTAP